MPRSILSFLLKGAQKEQVGNSSLQRYNKRGGMMRAALVQGLDFFGFMMEWAE